MTSPDNRPSHFLVADVPQPPRLPVPATEEEFRRWEEARDFWFAHDASPYWDVMEDVTDSPPPELAIGPGRQGSRSRHRPPAEELDSLSVALPRWLIDAVDERAEARLTSTDSLLRLWLTDRLRNEDQGAEARARAR